MSLIRAILATGLLGFIVNFDLTTVSLRSFDVQYLPDGGSSVVTCGGVTGSTPDGGTAFYTLTKCVTFVPTNQVAMLGILREGQAALKAANGL